MGRTVSGDTVFSVYKVIGLWDRIIRRIIRIYHKRSFIDLTKNHSKGLFIVDKVYLFNRKVQVGENVTIYPGVVFMGDGMIKLGDNVNIGPYTVIYSSAKGGVSIGRNTMIAAHCYIIDSDHGHSGEQPIIAQKDNVAPILIENDCWLASGVKILMGSTVKEGAVIGAGAVVKGLIGENCIAAGVPAKEIGKRK